MLKIIMLVCSLFFLSCAITPPPESEIVYETESLKILKFSNHVYQHISYLDTQNYGKIPSNGVIFTDLNESIIMDTPVDAKSSLELIQWIRNSLKSNIKFVIPTHFHVDCIGGLKTFHENEINSYALDKTLVLAKENQVKALPQNTFKNSKIFEFGKRAIVVSFLGEGHTKDNVIAYFTDEKVLFGGCLVKELNAGKGNLEDANVEVWPHTMSNLKNHYGRSRLVIPGHGKAGGTELIDYTLQLMSEK